MKKFGRYLQLPATLTLLAGISTLWCGSLHAQSSYGSVQGTVADSTGAVIPAATVTITDVATNETHRINTDSAGNYRFVDLAPAVYRVDVEKAGFKHFVLESVTVQTNTTTREDIPLLVGAVNESVVITTETPLLQTDSGTLSTKVEGQQVQEMPLNGRNIMNLLELAPGVIPSNTLEQQTGMNQSGTGTNLNAWNGFTTNGGDQTEFMDGAPLNILSGQQGVPSVALVPTQDSTQEFSIDTSANSADQGRTTGGVINMTSRSGTNQYHGSVYEYLRNAAFNANNFFNIRNGLPRVKWNQNQYGLNIGMPIKKDKLFFFGSWEVFDLKTQVPTTATIPTVDMQNGIFARQITDPNAPGDGCVITHNPTPSGTVYPNGTWTLGSACLNPTAQVMKTFWPAPTNSGQANNYTINGPDGDHQNQMNVRVDYDLSSKQRIFVHEAWWHIQDIPYNFFPTNTKWNFGSEAATFNNNMDIIGDTYTVSPKTVIDVRATWLRFLFGAYGSPNNVDYSQFGPAWATLGALVPAGNKWLPQVNVSGGAHSLTNIIQSIEGMQQHYDTYGLNGSVTHIFGQHSLKIGGEARLMDAENGVSQFATGNTVFGINFTGNQNAGTGDEWAEFLMGYPKSGTFGGGYPNSIYSYYQAYYVQDTWQTTRKLTLNLGLRYELPGGMAERKNSLAVLLPNAVDPYTDVTGTEVLTASPAYGARTSTQVRHDLLAPRVAFAYRLDNNSVVRGGFGITYQGVDLDSGAPSAVVNSATASFTNVSSPVIHLDNPFPAGVIQPSHRSNPAFMQTLMQNAAGSGGYSASAPNPFIKFPYVEEWNLTTSHQFGNNFQTSLSYVGTHAVQLKAGGGIDEIPASAYTVITNGTTQTAVATTGPNAGSLLSAKYNGTGVFCTPNGAVCNTNWTVGQSLQPYPYYKNFTINNLTYGNQHYNALQMQSQYRMKGAGEVGGAFTWAKTINDTSGTQDYYNHRADRSVAGVPMRLVVNYVYPLPFGNGQKFGHFNGVAGKLVSGWALNGITSFQHGSYLAMSENNTNLLNKNYGAGSTRPNYTPGCIRTVSGTPVSRINEWFNTSCFSYPGDYSYGNENVNDPVLFGQGLDNWDIAMLKSTKLGDRATFQFRVETFDIFNHPQFGNPNTAQGSTSFGVVTTQANNPRLLQLSGRINF